MKKMQCSTEDTIGAVIALLRVQPSNDYISQKVTAFEGKLPSTYSPISNRSLGEGHYFQDGIYLVLDCKNVLLPAMYRGKDLKGSEEGYCTGVPDVVADVYYDPNNLKLLDYRTKLYQKKGVRSISNVILTKGFVENYARKDDGSYTFSVENLIDWEGNHSNLSKGECIVEVIRKTRLETDKIQVGDQITVNLFRLGSFTATAQKVTENGVLFLFDDVIDKAPMNKKDVNKGDFDKSGMRKYLKKVILPAFPEELRNEIREITLPTYGEIFGHDDYYEIMEPDDDEQFELMKRRGNRVCDYDDDWCWWWLRNAVKERISSASFAVSNGNGRPNYQPASAPTGIRPEFWLVKEPPNANEV